MQLNVVIELHHHGYQYRNAVALVNTYGSEIIFTSVQLVTFGCSNRKAAVILYRQMIFEVCWSLTNDLSPSLNSALRKIQGATVFKRSTLDSQSTTKSRITRKLPIGAIVNSSAYTVLLIHRFLDSAEHRRYGLHEWSKRRKLRNGKLPRMSMLDPVYL